MKNLVLGVLGAAFSFGVAAQSIDLPSVKAGDTWTYQETKRWVKSVEEYYNANGVRTERYTSELESFKVN